ncbi:MAG TPA: uroporphyrinogen decarboxylase family protein [Thermoleophilia bacterium]|nr:uroporphyrinogen decarboxylase family protein [Thermoleophilia bacterium]
MTTPRELCHAALRMEETERVPVFLDMEGIARRALGVSFEDFCRDGELAARAYIAMNELIGDDMIRPYFDVAVESDGFGQPTVYAADEAPHADRNWQLIQSPDDYYKIEPFDVEEAERIKQTLRMVDVLVAEVGDRISLNGEPMDPMVTLGNMRGMEALLMDCVLHKEAVKHALRIVTDIEIAYAQALVKHGCDVLTNCWDYGNPSIMSEKLWREVVADDYRRFYKGMKETGAYVVAHMCDPHPYVDLGFEIGYFDAIQNWGMPKGCADWAEFKEKYGSKVCIAGGWSPVRLTEIDAAQVKKESKELIRILGKGGGLILGPGCEYPYSGPIINCKAMVDAAAEMAAEAKGQSEAMR